MVQGAWTLLLSRYSGRDDVVVGVTVSGRPPELEGVESMVGLFINTLPVRMRVRENEPLVDWLRSLQDRMLAMRPYQYSSLASIQQWSDVAPGSPLFEHLFVFENYPVGEALDLSEDGLRVRGLSSIEQTDYPLSVSAVPGRELSLEVIYGAARFSGEAIGRMLEHLTVLLEGISGAADSVPVRGVSMLSESERRRVLYEWNDTRCEYPSESNVISLFEERVDSAPDAVAVVFEGASWTYAELNARANAIALALKNSGRGLRGCCRSLPRALDGDGCGALGHFESRRRLSAHRSRLSRAPHPIHDPRRRRPRRHHPTTRRTIFSRRSCNIFLRKNSPTSNPNPKIPTLNPPARARLRHLYLRIDGEPEGRRY